MVLWETEFFAISVVTGEIERYRGVFINAMSLTEAYRAVRKMNMNFLQLTGDWFNNFEEVIKNDNFYNPIMNDDLNIQGMSFDDFCDWIDNALTVDDLLAAKEIVKETVGNPIEYLKIIDTYIKKKNEENNKEDSNEEGEEAC
jgi:hypothetical protein